MRPRITTTPSLAGRLLLAHPALRDPNFRRTVVFMSAHDTEGAMGVVMNRATGKTLGDISEDFGRTSLSHVPVFDGGPVDREKLILAGWRMHDDGDGFKLFFGIDPAKAMALANEQGEAVRLRAFAGYSGWTGGQLENELQQGTWVISDVPADFFSLREGGALWQEVLGRQGDEWRLLAGEPDDPKRN